MRPMYSDGPDQVIDAKNYWTSNPEEPVKLRITKEGPASRSPISIPSLLKEISLKYPETPALRYKHGEKDWETITYKKYKEKVMHFSKAFIKLDLSPRHSVSIMSHNCPQYSIAVLAAIHAGGIASGIYTSSSPEAMLDVLNDSRANILIVADDDQLEKALSIRHQAKYLNSIVQIFPSKKAFEYKNKVQAYYTWNDLEELDMSQYQMDLNKRLANIAVNECCTLVFTSGTTGKSKGVMLSHDSITWNATTVVKRFPDLSPGKESCVSYLPMCHIASLMFDLYMPIVLGMTVYFAEKNAIKGNLIDSLRSIKPTRLVTVPRILEKIQEFIQKSAHNLNSQNLKETIGLSHTRSIVCGGAPLDLDTKNFFVKNKFPVIEVYGLSEGSGTHAMIFLNRFNEKSVGKVLDSQVKVSTEDITSENPGELLLQGRNIFMGYIGMKIATKEALGESGWYHTGDVGYIDNEGFIYITGRLKELIITAGGSKVAPLSIENQIKLELPIISNICLVGDKEKYLSALVTLLTEIDSQTGEPLDTLKPEVRLWMKNLGLNYTTISEVIAAGPDPKVLQQITEAIDRVNAKATTHIHTVKKFMLLPKDFSLFTGEINANSKLKRSFVREKYEHLISSLYTPSSVKI